MTREKERGKVQAGGVPFMCDYLALQQPRSITCNVGL